MSSHKIYRVIEEEAPQPERANTGLVNYDQMVAYVQSAVQSSQFYELVEARVQKVYRLESDLDIVVKRSGDETKNWKQLGTIDVKMIHNNELVRNVQPLCSHFNCEPLVDEKVIISEYSGRYYYSFPLATMRKVDHNRETKPVGESQVFPALTFMNRSLFSGPGDTTIQGRFGNYINLGADVESNGFPAYPSIVIGNNQSADEVQNELKKQDENFPHYHDVNSIGSSITLRSTPSKSSIIKGHDNKEGDFLRGNLITINSDEILLNTKANDIELSSAAHLNLGANENVNISSNKGKINIGTPDSTTSQSPAVRYSELKPWLARLITNINVVFGLIEKQSENLGNKKITVELDKLKSTIDTFASKKVNKD